MAHNQKTWKQDKKRTETIIEDIKVNQNENVGTTVENINSNHGKNVERIVDRLDLQLLVAVIVIFISAWIYLCDKICDFTAGTPLNEQNNFLLAHYILTVYMLLCLYITFIKGRYIFDKEKDITTDKLKYFKLFIDTWFYVLLVEFAIVLSTSFISYIIWIFVIFTLLITKMYFLHFKWIKSICLSFLIFFLFPFFISLMTVTVKNITITANKDYYSLDDNIILYINIKGYACNYEIVNLDDRYLYDGSDYELRKNMLFTHAYSVKNNELAVGVVSPASGKYFFLYPFYKLTGRIDKFSMNFNDVRENSVYYKKIDVNIKPF